jgi:predicted phage terminase large subunit-like protein
MTVKINPKEFGTILRTDLNAFTEKSFAHLHSGARLGRNHHHEAIVHQLNRVLRGEIKRLIVNAPPRSLKSLIGSVAFPAYVLGVRPNAKLICASYSQDLANKLAADFRRIVQAPWYTELFRIAPPMKETESEYQTALGGFRFTTSVGGTLTGRGADIMVIDDPLSAADANSKTSREKVNEWFKGSLLSRLDDKHAGAIIVIMQRLHQDDLTGFLLEQGGWELLKLPAIAPADTRVPLSDSRVYEWKTDEPLDRVREPLSTLSLIKRQLGLDFFTAQYLQEPVPSGGNVLKREWLREYEGTPAYRSDDEVIQSWDTAMKATATSDYSVCLTFRVRNKNQYYLIDVYRGRPEFPELAKLVCTHAQRFQPKAILIEDKGSGISLIQTVRKSGLQGVIPMSPSKDKETRLLGQTPKLESGSLFLPRSSPWLADFMQEYLAFPKGRHDDQIDALSQFLEWRRNREDSMFEFDFGYGDDSLPLTTYFGFS